MARHRSALRLAFAATVAMVWGTMVREPLPGLTAVLTAQILVGMPRPPRPRQAAALVAVIAITGGAAYAVTAAFTDRLPMLTAALGLLFFVFCDARTGGGPTLAPRHHAAECHRGSPGPHLPSGHPGGRRDRDPRHRGGTGDARRLAPVRALPGTAGRGRQRHACWRRARHRLACDGTWWRGAHPRQGRHRAAGATLLPRRAHCARLPGATRARHFPDRTGSGSRARPTRDPAAGQPRWKRRCRRRLGGLGGRSAAACTDADGAAWLAGLRSMDHDRRAAGGWRGGADWPRDISDALRPRFVARSVRRPCPRSDSRYRVAFPLYARSDHAASAADRSTMAGRHDWQLGAYFVISISGVTLA